MAKQRTKAQRNTVINILICAFAFIVMVVFLIFVDGIDNITNSIKKIQPIFLVLCVAFMGLYWLCEAATVHSILKPLCPKAKFRNTFADTIIGQYFNCITPGASGGQPMQAYYFVKFGVPLGSALTALLARFIVYQFVLTLYSVVTLAVGFGRFGDDLSKKGLMPFVFIGFAVNTCVIIFLLGIAVWKSGTIKVVNAFITLLSKMHIIKNPMRTRLYISREINKLHNNFKFLKKHVRVILKAALFTFVQLTVYLSISYMLFLGFGLRGTGLWQIISYQAYVLMISSFIPLPGAMGAAELGYAGFFGGIFGRFTSVSTMLWRVFTFYLPIIVGMVVTFALKNKGISAPSEQDFTEINKENADELDAE